MSHPISEMVGLGLAGLDATLKIGIAIIVALLGLLIAMTVIAAGFAIHASAH